MKLKKWSVSILFLLTGAILATVPASGTVLSSDSDDSSLLSEPSVPEGEDTLRVFSSRNESGDHGQELLHALVERGDQYYEQGEEKAYQEAVKWYRNAAEQGYAQAQYRLGDCYEKGLGVEQSWREAAEWYRKAAVQENAEAQICLGYCYEKGNGVAQSYEEAVKWYRKAAQQGYADAQHNLGYCYKYGQGVEQSYEEAVKWFQKAARQGHAGSQNNLGTCYYYGQGVAQSSEEAVKWFRKAADQGNMDSQYNLGNSYYYGLGVEQSSEEAVNWFKKAAQQGHIYAQTNLGFCYYNGFGTEQSYTEAVKWFRKAAAQGDVQAQYNLAICIENGLGTEQSYEEALKWLQTAADQGYAEAQKRIEELQGVEIALQGVDHALQGVESGAFEDGPEDGTEYSTSILNGSIYTFGRYEQDNNTENGKEPVEWIVLESDGRKALLISKYALNVSSYNRRWIDMTWEECSLRAWLNGDFYNDVFSAEEQEIILTCTVTAEDNAEYGTEAGKDTEDKVFLLSIGEAERFFVSDEDRQCAPSAYTAAQGAWAEDSEYSWWWLRSPGGSSRAAYVSEDGSIDRYGNFVNYGDGAIRPAVWIDLEV